MKVKITLYMIFFILFFATLNLFSNPYYQINLGKKNNFIIQPKIINSKSYISINNLQKILPESNLLNNNSIIIKDYKLKVYPGSFYMLIEHNDKNVYQFSYPVIAIDNEILLPYHETFQYLEQFKIISINRMDNIILLLYKSKKEIKLENNDTEIISNTDIEQKSISTSTKSSKHSSNKVDNKVLNKEPDLKSGLEEISPIIDESLDLLINDGSYELRNILKNGDSNQVFSPDNYRLPKHIKRKNKQENE